MSAVTTEAVIAAVAKHYGYRASDLRSRRRNTRLARARAVAMYLARTRTYDSYLALGFAFGGKHHTTVIHAVEKMIACIEHDRELETDIDIIETALGIGVEPGHGEQESAATQEMVP